MSAKVETLRVPPPNQEPQYHNVFPAPTSAWGATVHIDYLAPFHGLSGEAAVRRAQCSMTICAKGSLFLGTEAMSTKSVFLRLLSQPAAGVGM